MRKLPAIGVLLAAACLLTAAPATAATTSDADVAALAAQVGALVDQTLGPGNASVDVNVTVDHNRTRAVQLSYVRRATALQGQGVRASRTGYRLNSSATMYARGERVTATTFAPGAVRQIHIGLLVSSRVSPQAAKQLKRTVARFAGLKRSRGDTIALARTAFAAPTTTTAATLLTKLAAVKWALLGAGVLAFLFFAARGARRALS